MARSRTICVLKRDGTVERFDQRKLRACLLRVIPPDDGDCYLADALSAAVRCYLARRHQRCVSSTAVFEMTLAALRTVKMHASAGRLEAAHARRLQLRGRLSVQHESSRTAWSKQWLFQHARSQWSLGRPVARILAGQVEQELMRRRGRVLGRQDVLDMLSRLVSAYGLSAEAAVPAEPL